MQKKKGMLRALKAGAFQVSSGTDEFRMKHKVCGFTAQEQEIFLILQI